MTIIPALERELVAAAGREYHKPRQRRSFGLPTLAATTSGIAAALVAVMLLFSSSAPDAFAGWTTTPSAPTQAALTEALVACGHLSRADVVAVESRGPFTALVYVLAATPWQCVTKGRRLLIHERAPFPTSVVITPAEGKVGVPIVSQRVIDPTAEKSLQALDHRQDALYRGADSAQEQDTAAASPKARSLRAAATQILLGNQSLTAVSGPVGPGVSAVTFVLHDGTHVKATVSHGWYLAWWPGSKDPANHIPTAIRVGTAHRTTPAPYTAKYLAALYKPCLLTQVCRSGVWRIRLIRSVSASLTKHFALFRNTTPISLKTRKARAALNLPAPGTALFGLDVSQTRAVSFGDAGTIWVIPGTEGACIRVVPPANWNLPESGAGGCTTLLSGGLLQKGLIISGTQSVFGLVPDGNRNVRVCMTSGRRITLAVKDNVVYGLLPGRPGTIYLKNAYGKPTRQLVWVSRHC